MPKKILDYVHIMLSLIIIFLCFCPSNAQEWIHGKENKCIVTYIGPQNHSIMRYVPYVISLFSII